MPNIKESSYEKKRRIAAEWNTNGAINQWKNGEDSIGNVDLRNTNWDIINEKKPYFEVAHSSGGPYTPSQLQKFISKLRKANSLARRLNK